MTGEVVKVFVVRKLSAALCRAQVRDVRPTLLGNARCLGLGCVGLGLTGLGSLQPSGSRCVAAIMPGGVDLRRGEVDE